MTHRYSREIRIDLIICLVASSLLGLVAVRMDLFEKIHETTRLYEAYELDEILCFLLTLLLGFSVLALRYIFILRRLARELRHSHEIIRKHNEIQSQKEKLAALGQIASGLAHEISNALQPTIGLGGYIKEGLREQGKVRHSAFMDVMMDSARHAQHIIDNVLAFAQNKSLTMVSHQAAAAFEQAIAFAAERLASTIRIEMHGLDTLEDEAGRPLVVSYNPTALSQMFLNLLKNASNAMDHEGLIVIACHPCCNLSDGNKSTSIAVSITDRGSGMDNETLHKAFDPFFTTKEASEGSGLGLPVVYNLMQQHKGEISVTSKPGKGTTFTLTFPAIINTP